MGNRTYIGLDLGASGLKGIIINDGQQILAEARAPMMINCPHDGWPEQEPDGHRNLNLCADAC
ncbi:hypothetical protein GJU92_13535 [Brucella sp. 10RB9213]|nr:hypothetical protein [Brucella sp. 10RB9213]